ncbi:hypothetical protein GCM10022403_087670 [Streptomyces coacervatus]|uniref:TniQ domain-containing protein n=1 Tax=Streptomyces coacervatus TaxID=647381 RepID=A0ABP7JEB3_9ACTN
MSQQGAHSIPSRLLLRLEASQLRSFAKATMLDEEAVDDLTLRPLSNRYPPLAEALPLLRKKTALPPWLRFETTSYCPSCLAGDGSTIQNLHGGPWKRLWHLPIVFACLDHNVFLRDVCPACQQQPLQRTPGTNSAIPTHGLASLHPAQCRRTVALATKQPCGARLDRPAHHTGQDLPPLTTDIATVQQELLDLLKGTASVDAQTSFADLNLMATIISAAWPHHPEVSAPTELLDAFSSHHDTQQELIERREPQIKGPPRLDTSWRITPQSAPATAALLAMSRHCLRLPAVHLREQLTELLGHAPGRNHPRWGGALEATSAQRCSPQLRLALRGTLAERPTGPLHGHDG